MSKHGIIGSCDLIIFDWDGTLNSMRLIMRANETMKRSLGMWNRDSAIKDVSSMDYDLKRKLKNEQMKNDLMTYMFDIFLNLSKPRLHNGTVSMLRRIKGSRKKIAIFTNGSGQRVIRELNILGIKEYFDAIISARDMHALKPNPTGIRATLKYLKVRPGRCIYIGDMVDDIITAKLAHVHSCAIADGFDSYHKLKSSRPEYIFRSIEEFSKAL
ncbi:MAG: HAD family hydrolase [Candidatus Micrarchaeaceae archaeon]